MDAECGESFLLLGGELRSGARLLLLARKVHRIVSTDPNPLLLALEIVRDDDDSVHEDEAGPRFERFIKIADLVEQ
ncbi:hypothetical protein OG612_00310 [Streptomyces sp. NBC_01527]|uniref:hypothetical protein n=1 Tax=Streptomyces sp. NBC_01527 TaxID=2903894 RepID=UPI00386586FC